MTMSQHRTPSCPPITSGPGHSAGHSQTNSIPTSPQLVEEVCTVFIVGFPDDFSEREFMNMFTFCDGFEACSLKSSADDEIPSSLSKHEQDGNVKRKLMGFAKFKSRIAALEAKEVLNGKRVDFESNYYLKCEMAKKNLHVKRIAEDEFSSVSTTSAFCSPYLAAQDLDGLNASYPSASSNSISMMNKLNELDTSSLSLSQLPSLGSSNTSLTPLFRPRAYSATASCYSTSLNSKINSNLTINCNANSDATRTCLNELMETSFDQTLLNNSMSSETLSKSGLIHPGSISVNKAPGTPLMSPMTTFFSGSNSSGGMVGSTGFLEGSNNGFESALYHNLDPYARLNNNSIVQHPSEEFNHYSQSHLDKQMYCLNFKKVKPVLSDQNNPPCNTLYVGNLPVNTSEEELRHLFSACVGYKRLCFRLKPNHGPMCFVEFETVEHATAAMNALYGIPLSNSIKGGIRLSYSKNPLGVRSVNNPNNNPLNHQCNLMIHPSFM